MSLDSPDEVPIWYAMSAPYREMKVADYLKTHQDIKVFLPLERCERMVGQHIRKRVISYRLVVRNLLFVKATPGRMRDLKQIYNSMLQFKTRPMDGHSEVITIPDKEMEDFMALCENVEDANKHFFLPGEIKLRPEARVRIEDGVFAGLEGYYQKVKGCHSEKGKVKGCHSEKGKAKGSQSEKGKDEKCFVVKIEGFLSCAAFITECNYVSLAGKNEKKEEEKGKKK